MGAAYDAAPAKRGIKQGIPCSNIAAMIAELGFGR
jgi:hypothetical protein